MVGKNKSFKKGKKAVASSLNPSQKKEIKKLIKDEERAQDEMKENLVVWSPSVSSTGSVQAMGLIAQGDDYNKRQGNNLNMQELEIRGYISNLVATGPNQSDDIVGRFLVVRDMLCDGADPAATDIFETASSPTSTFNHVHFLNKPHRFQVLYDKEFILEAIENATGSPRIHLFNKKIKLHNMQAKYITNGSTASALGEGQLFLIGITNAAGGEVDLNVNAALRWYDD